MKRMVGYADIGTAPVIVVGTSLDIFSCGRPLEAMGDLETRLKGLWVILFSFRYPNTMLQVCRKQMQA